MSGTTLFVGAGLALPPHLVERLAATASAVEERLEREVQSDVEIVDGVGRHTLRAGGKRLRPAFVALAADAIADGAQPDRVTCIGACMELIHMATLIHDDVVDGADSRRGVPTAGLTFGNTGAILAGDVLLSKAMCLLAADGDLAIIRVVSAAVVEMAEGEALEVETRGRFDLSEEEHRRILRMKTAAFMECCCRVGAMLSGGEESAVAALGEYGHHVGMAFQIADDLLDYRGRESVTGKPPGADFREGCATLPLIHLRDHLTEEESRFARSKFGETPTEDELSMLVAWMEARGAFGSAEEAADRHVEAAIGALAPLPASDARGALTAVARMAAHRVA